jgi:hypothetical protein
VTHQSVPDLPPVEAPEGRTALPIVILLALTTTAFLTILTETMHAAVLPLIATDLNKSSGEVGMMVGVYAVGAAVASNPSWPRPAQCRDGRCSCWHFWCFVLRI